MDELVRLRDLVTQYIGPCIVIGTPDAPIVQLQGGVALTPAQQTTLDQVVRFWRAGITDLTLPEWLLLEDEQATKRTFKQRSQSDFIALTQNQRDRALYDAVIALIKVQNAQIRDKQ